MTFEAYQATMSAMAMFREHISVGALVALVGTGATFLYALITDPILLALLFLVMVVMSFAPDLDSDESIPYNIIFGAFTIGCTWVAVTYAFKYYSDDLALVIGIPSATLLFVWFVVGGMFKSLTHHRGMFHSVPAMVIAGLATYLVARSLQESDVVSIVFGIAAGVGFLTHLILDELYAGITLDGKLFTPKKSLGTALKLYSSSGFRTLLAYILLTALAYMALT